MIQGKIVSVKGQIIEVEFTGATKGKVNVQSNSDIELHGRVSNPTGDTTITSTTGKITTLSDEALVGGKTISLNAHGQIGTSTTAISTDVTGGSGSYLAAVTTNGLVNIHEVLGDLLVNQITTPHDAVVGSGNVMLLGCCWS